MIGTNNNSSKDTKPENVASAIEELVAKIRAKQPNAKIVLHPIFPRGNSAQSERHVDARARNDKTNALLKQFADRDGKIIWIDFNDKLVDATGWVPKSIMPDEIHPSAAGYEIWMDALAPVIGK
jgi:lysophospholipase L1-like esterase